MAATASSVRRRQVSDTRRRAAHARLQATAEYSACSSSISLNDARLARRPEAHCGMCVGRAAKSSEVGAARTLQAYQGVYSASPSLTTDIRRKEDPAMVPVSTRGHDRVVQNGHHHDFAVTATNVLDNPVMVSQCTRTSGKCSQCYATCPETRAFVQGPGQATSLG